MVGSQDFRASQEIHQEIHWMSPRHGFSVVTSLTLPSPFPVRRDVSSENQ